MQSQRSGMATWIIVLIVCVGVIIPVGAIVAAIAIPNLIEARKHGNEASAIGALKTIENSQTIYREGDKDNNNELDYAKDLKALQRAGLIDDILAGGTKQGYVFEVRASTTTPDFVWMATANPAVPETTGDRYFATNHEGVTYYRTKGPIPINDEGTMPPDARPVGR